MFGELTFGESIFPILDSLENAILAHEDVLGAPPGYPDAALRCVIAIFWHVATEKMWQYHERLGMPYAQREKHAAQCAKEFRSLILRYLDVAPEKLLKK